MAQQHGVSTPFRFRSGKEGKNQSKLRWKTGARNSGHPKRQRQVSRLSLVIDFLRRIVTLFVVAVPLNYLWELGQSPLYLPPSRLRDMWWHCFKASLGDGLLVGLIYVICSILFGKLDWYVRIRTSRYYTMMATGLAVGVLVEWAALRTHRWTYATAMPLIPGLQIGLVPVVQMLVLPLLVFWIAGTCTAGRRIA